MSAFYAWPNRRERFIPWNFKKISSKLLAQIMPKFVTNPKSKWILAATCTKVMSEAMKIAKNSNTIAAVINLSFIPLTTIDKDLPSKDAMKTILMEKDPYPSVPVTSHYLKRKLISPDLCLSLHHKISASCCVRTTSFLKYKQKILSVSTKLAVSILYVKQKYTHLLDKSEKKISYFSFKKRNSARVRMFLSENNSWPSDCWLSNRATLLSAMPQIEPRSWKNRPFSMSKKKGTVLGQSESTTRNSEKLSDEAENFPKK